MNEILLGVDEVGRGCIAGPLYAAAVILKHPIDGLKDSKLLSKKQRDIFFDLILANALYVDIGFVDSLYIDKYGLTQANRSAMLGAVKKLKLKYDKLIVDGKYNFLKDLPKSEAIVKADQKYQCVSAASVIAKVTRDRQMKIYGTVYPGYNFSSNMGYPTKEHYDAISKLGITPIHRTSFRLFS